MEKWELENLVMEKYENITGLKKNYNYITIMFCPGVIYLKNVGELYSKNCNDTTCDDCWENATKILRRDKNENKQ